MAKKTDEKKLEDAIVAIENIRVAAINALENIEAAKKKEAEHKPVQEGVTYDNSFDCLAVTNVQVFPFKEGPSLGHIKALASIVLNDQMLIRGLRVMEGENGLFVGYPCDPFYKGEDFRSLCNPITRQLREHIENCVLEKYQASIVEG